MKKILEKIKSNKLLFGIFMIIVFILFDFITTGISGTVIDGFYGVVGYINSLENLTVNGKEIFGEIVWALCLIPVILIFKNEYIFYEKKKSFKETYKLMFFQLLLISAVGFEDFALATGFRHVDFNELIAMIILYTVVGIFEEFLCRGWLLNEFMEKFGKNRKGVVYSLLLSAAIFGVMHITNVLHGATLAGTIVQIVFAFGFGLYLGVIYLKTHNIWAVAFMHAFYDLQVSLSTINSANSCLTTSVDVGPVLTIIIGLLVNAILISPALFEFVKSLSKRNMNEMLDTKNQLVLTEQEIKSSQTYERVITIIEAVFTSIITLIFVLVGFVSIANYEEDKCLSYKTYSINEMSEHITAVYNYTQKEVEFSTENINLVMCDDNSGEYCAETEEVTNKLSFRIEDGKFYFSNRMISTTDYTNLNNDEDYLDDIYAVEFSEFEYNGILYISIIAEESDGYSVYFSDYITEKNLLEDDLMENFKTSFTRLDLPSIYSVGYFESSKDGTRFPLFIASETGDYYLYTDDAIYRVDR